MASYIVSSHYGTEFLELQGKLSEVKRMLPSASTESAQSLRKSPHQTVLCLEEPILVFQDGYHLQSSHSSKKNSHDGLHGSLILTTLRPDDRESPHDTQRPNTCHQSETTDFELLRLTLGSHGGEGTVESRTSLVARHDTNWGTFKNHDEQSTFLLAKWNAFCR
jgi:hypothetical protein